MFHILDAENNGFLSVPHFLAGLEALNAALDYKALPIAIEAECEAHGVPEAAFRITLEVFVRLLRAARLSLLNAVAFDIAQGLRRHRELAQEGLQLPLSVLVNREAFQVLFPAPKKKGGNGAADKVAVDAKKSKDGFGQLKEENDDPESSVVMNLSVVCVCR